MNAEMTRRAYLQPCQSTTIFGRVELSEALGPLAAAGYEYIELSRNSSRRAECKPMADDLGLNVWAVHGTLDLAAGMGNAAERQAAVEAELRAMDEVAVYAPCPYIAHYMCRNTEPEGADQWKEVVARLHERAAGLGFVLSLEQVPAKPAGVGLPYLCKSAEVAAFVRSFAPEYLGICMDLNHVNLHEEIGAAAGNSAGLIRTIHVSDNHGLEEEHLAPGDGVIEWAAALGAVYGAGYEGPVNMELHVPPCHELFVRTREWAERMAEGLRVCAGEG